LQPTKILPEGYSQAGILDLSSNRPVLIWLNIAGLGLFFLFGWIFLQILIMLRPLDVSEGLVVNLSNPVSIVLSCIVFILLNILMIILHEAAHGVFFWAFTRSCPEFAFRGLYAYAALPDWYLPRNMYLVTCLAPLVLISLAGILLLVFVPSKFFWSILVLMTLNASGAAGDFLVAAWLLLQPPTCLANDRGDAFSLFRFDTRGSTQ
jgi:hypothetical protein